MRQPPKGYYPGEYTFKDVDKRYSATGEFRPPRKGEYYLSGAIITAYKAVNDLTQSHWIAVANGKQVKCQCCNGTGKVEVPA